MQSMQSIQHTQSSMAIMECNQHMYADRHKGRVESEVATRVERARPEWIFVLCCRMPCPYAWRVIQSFARFKGELPSCWL